ncbi:hypothetical protein N431DRAFT_397095 [Stipitochalara longipes BDJ]|nr:hypothetical protein N431DRAFT_397095 [Stipitochalara longipes BDJ]
MDQTTSPPLQQQASRALAHYRNELRIRLGRMNSRKVVPQPIYSLETFAEESDETIDSDSDSAVTSDTDPTTNDSENDVYMVDEENTQPEGHNTPASDVSQLSMEEQNHIEHVKFIRDTAERMDMPEDVQGEDNSNEDMDTFLYPDPQISEMVPPSTPRLLHMDLPPSSIDNNEIKINGLINDISEGLMEDCEGDLSNTICLMPAHKKPSFLSNEVHSRTFSGNSDEAAGFPPSIEIDISDNVPSKTLHLTTQDREDMDSFEISRHVCEQPALIPSSGSESWLPANPSAMEVAAPFKKRTPSAAPNQIPSLGRVAVHTNNFIRSSMTGLKHDAMPEQAPAAELATPSMHSTATEQEELPDPVLESFMEDMEEMKAGVLVETEAERRVLCRAHKMRASKHYTTWPPTFPARIRLEMNKGVKPIDRERSPTMEEIRELKNHRKSIALWRRHAVWDRSPLCAETRLQPLQDPSGEYRIWRLFHTGMGPTGGDPCFQFWRHCDQGSESLNAL